jgi:hypothetical protein
MALGLTQPLIEMSTRNLPVGNVASRFPCHAILSGLINQATQLFLETQLCSGDNDAAIFVNMSGTTHVLVNGLHKTAW